MRSRPKLNTTSSAVISSPLWNLTPWRSFSSTVWSSMRRHSVASPGTASRLAAPVPADQPFPDRREEDALADVRLLAQHVERVRVRHLLHGDGDRRTVVGLARWQSAEGSSAPARGRAHAENVTAGMSSHGCFFLLRCCRLQAVLQRNDSARCRSGYSATPSSVRYFAPVATDRVVAHFENEPRIGAQSAERAENLAATRIIAVARRPMPVGISRRYPEGGRA